MPLTMADLGRICTVKKIAGKSETCSFLESLGLVPGSTVIIISRNQGGLILKVKESRVAIAREMANKVLV